MLNWGNLGERCFKENTPPAIYDSSHWNSQFTILLLVCCCCTPSHPPRGVSGAFIEYYGVHLYVQIIKCPPPCFAFIPCGGFTSTPGCDGVEKMDPLDSSRVRLRMSPSGYVHTIAGNGVRNAHRGKGKQRQTGNANKKIRNHSGGWLSIPSYTPPAQTNVYSAPRYKFVRTFPDTDWVVYKEFSPLPFSSLAPEPTPRGEVGGGSLFQQNIYVLLAEAWILFKEEDDAGAPDMVGSN